ncbi:MAG: HPP family protein [Nitrososphaeraceae archaeon]
MVNNFSYKLYQSLQSLRKQNVNTFLESPIIVENDLSISKLIGILLEKNCYECFLHYDKKIYVINIRDLLNVKNITSRKASTVGKIIPSLNKRDNIGKAIQIFKYYRLRSLPITENNNIIGQLNCKAIIKQLSDLGSKSSQHMSESFFNLSNEILGKDIMTPKPIVLDQNETVASARNIMIKHRIDHIPIIDKNRKSLVGIVTSTHIIKSLLPSEKIGRDSIGINEKITRLNFPVKSIMDKNVVISKIDDNLKKILNSMLITGSTYVILQSVGETQGIVTFTDILSLLKERVEYDLPCYIIGLPEDSVQSEMAKSKFINLVKTLRKIFPEIEETRCIIKIKNTTGNRQRYEINVNIISTAKVYSYTKTGWELAQIMDEIANNLKRKVIKSQRKMG